MKLNPIVTCVFIIMSFCPSLKGLKCYVCTGSFTFCTRIQETECPKGTEKCYKAKKDTKEGKSEAKGCTPATWNMCEMLKQVGESKCKECAEDLCNAAKKQPPTVVLIYLGLLVSISWFVGI